MPSVNLAALPGVAVRPLVVAIAHLPILIMACCAVPVWMMAIARPVTHGELALRLLKELRTWSRDVIDAMHGVQSR